MLESIESPPTIRRRKVVLCGFFGRGNAGDEAFLHVQHALLSPHFDLAIVVEQAGAHPDFRSWYPYNSCEVWNFDEVNRVYEKDVVGVHVGGGSLPFASHAHFLLSAIDAGKRALVSGVDASFKSKGREDDIRREFYNRLDYFAVRHKRSLKLLKAADVSVCHGADWAIGLQSDKGISRDLDIVVTLRGFSEPTRTHRNQVQALDEYLSRQGRQVTYVPFAPEDRDYTKFCGIKDKSVLNLWHDPRTALSAIEKSKLTISIGRLHTLIFALVANKPSFAIDPGIIAGGKHLLNRKNQYFCEEMGLDFFESIQSFMDAQTDLSSFDSIGFPDDYRLRHQRMAEGMLQALQA